MTEGLLQKPLPDPWSFGVLKDGRVFFINDDDEITTWLHPTLGASVMTGYYRSQDLPDGWEVGYTIEGIPFYINHKERYTTPMKPNTTRSDTKKKRKPSLTGTITRPLFRRRSQTDRRGTDGGNNVGMKGKKLTAMRRDGSSCVARSGWLYKQDNSGMGGVRVWRKRWFVLADFCLFYYKDAREGDVLGSIVLPSYRISTVNPERHGRKYSFKIEHSGMRSYYISAESYHDMAEWIKLLTPLCSFQPARKVLSNNGTDDDAAKFGFTEIRRNENRSSAKDENGNNNNAKNHGVAPTTHTTAPNTHVMAPSSHRHAAEPNTYTTAPGSHTKPHTHATAPNSPGSSATAPNTHATVPDTQNKPHPQNKHTTPVQSNTHTNDTQRARNAQRARYSDTTHRNNINQDMHRRLSDNSHHQTNIVRNNSMLRLGDWVSSKKKRNSSMGNLNTVRPSSSRDSRTMRYESRDRRYKPGSYHDYMDSMEVASSIMSVPPVYRNNKTLSLPRPRSTQALNQRGKPTKSVGELHPPLTPVMGELHPPLTPVTPTSPNTYDVFSPTPTTTEEKFNYSKPPSSANIEIKQMDVKGRSGQLRAFAISVRKPPSDVQNYLKKVSEFESQLKTIERQMEGGVDCAGKLLELRSSIDAAEVSVKSVKTGIVGVLRKGYNDGKQTTESSEVELGRVEFILESLQRLRGDIRVIMEHCGEQDNGSYVDEVTPRIQESTGGKYFTLPGRGVTHATSVDSLTAATLARYARPNTRVTLQRTKSAAERLLHSSNGNINNDPNDIKRMQREINQNRRRTLNSSDFSRKSKTFGSHDPMNIGMDIKMAIRHQRMPKVLQRAKRDREFKHDDHVTDSDQSPRSPHIDVDQSDFDLTTELIVPNKVLIPDRLVDYDDVELTPEQEKIKKQKVDAIERMLGAIEVKLGQTAPNPTVHLAAALAAEAGTVARAVAFQAKHKNDDTATIQPFIV
ncbi:uncharacterized protein LOC113474055 [Ciona intestinalis]